MELSVRKNKILAAVVDRYILTGEPVGSKTVAAMLDHAVSSATIRNEMAELCELGYLEQPHTSSGRIPTQKGYRYYVDRLMGRYELASDEMYRIERQLESASSEPEALLIKASAILAELTGCAGISTTPKDEYTVIKKVELVPIGKKSIMVVLATSSGLLKSKVCRMDVPITLDLIELFYNVAAANFIGVRVSDIHAPLLQNIAASLGEKAFDMLGLVNAVADLAQICTSSELVLEGEANLLNHKELEANALELLTFLQDGDLLSKMLAERNSQLSVTIGKENVFKELENSSMILSSYSVLGQRAGSVGIIGPTRIDYARLIPSIKFLSQLVGKLLSDVTESD
ncbi:MAG: heat-inducible transcription repressor HrcA [Clostridiales bacterium]|nr:heat-inducible transcription repressor HrcA [Clostridiales bacterium]